MTDDVPDLDVAAMRVDYGSAEFDEQSVAPDWHTQFGRWLADAVTARLPEPNAMVLATADPTGRPSARTVLLRGYGADGFVFYTNYQSRKGRELSANPYASLVFPWYAIRRQVLVTGRVGRVPREQTEAYFATRPRESQLGAWASPQSRPVPDRAALDDAWRATAQRFPEGRPVPAPPHWGGYRLVPETVEFWQGRTARMHDRLRFRRTTAAPGLARPGGPDSGEPAGGWLLERLAP